jgi:hypothetical protein
MGTRSWQVIAVVGGLFLAGCGSAPAKDDALPQSIKNMQGIVMALHNYESTNRRFPPAALTDASGKPLLSWRVALLPHINEEDLYKAFKLDEPWDSPHNMALVPRMPKVYQSPYSKLAGEGKTTYQAIKAPGSVLYSPKPLNLSGIPDGSSNTALIVEMADDKAVIWTKPEDAALDKDPLQGVHITSGKVFLLGMGDGSIAQAPANTPAETLRCLYDSQEGKPVFLPPPK